MSRGSRDGNNAFTKDQSVSLVDEFPDLEKKIMRWNLSIQFVKELCLISEKKALTNQFQPMALSKMWSKLSGSTTKQKNLRVTFTIKGMETVN